MNNMADEIQVKMQELLNHLNDTYDEMAELLNSANYMAEDTITSKMATLMAIGLAKNYVAYINGDFETIGEATVHAMNTAQNDFVFEEE